MSNAAPIIGYFPTPPAELKRLSQIIGQLPNLQTLDFSNTSFIYAEFLGKGLENIYSLKSINLGNCWTGQYISGPDTWQGGIQLIQGLQGQHDLSHLNLFNNLIGLNFSQAKNPNSTLALANALNSWPQLKTLNLGYNGIGYEDPASATAFLEHLAGLAKPLITKEERLKLTF